MPLKMTSIIKYFCYKLNYYISHFRISVSFFLHIPLRMKVLFAHFGVYLHINSLRKYCFMEKENTKITCKSCGRKAQDTRYSKKPSRKKSLQK